MTKDVLVSISGLQYEISEDEAVEVISVGQYYMKNNKHYVLYDDLLDDENETGEITKNTLKIAPDIVEVYKKGSSNVHMVFEQGKKNMTYYNTPFGDLLIGIQTSSIKIEETEDDILVHITYALDVNYSFVSDCNITIKIRSKS